MTPRPFQAELELHMPRFVSQGPPVTPKPVNRSDLQTKKGCQPIALHKEATGSPGGERLPLRQCDQVCGPWGLGLGQ